MDEEASGQAAAPELPPRPPASTASPSPDLPPSPVVAPPLLDPPLPHSQNGGPPTGQAAEMEVEESYGAAPASPRGSRQYSSGSGGDGGNPAAATVIRRPGTELWAFGRGDCGQLGTDVSEDSRAPCMVEGLRGRAVVNAAPGALHSAAVTCECLRSPCWQCLNVSHAEGQCCLLNANLFCPRWPAAAADGELYSWGSNDAGQQHQSAPAPARVEALESFTVHQVACGSSHTLAVVDDGALAAFGSNEFGQCGLGPLAGTQARRLGQLQPASGPCGR